MSTINAAITCVGGYLPEYVMTNSELEKIVDTTDEWITSRTGIKERRVLFVEFYLEHFSFFFRFLF